MAASAFKIPEDLLTLANKDVVTVLIAWRMTVQSATVINSSISQGSNNSNSNKGLVKSGPNNRNEASSFGWGKKSGRK